MEKKCVICKKELGQITGGAFTGTDFKQMLLAAGIKCQNCGADFCYDCMTDLKSNYKNCPKCQSNPGW